MTTIKWMLDVGCWMLVRSLQVLTNIQNPTSNIRLSRSELAHHLDHGFHILHRGLRQDTASEVEDGAGARAGALQQIGDVQLELGQCREEDGGFEVALNRLPLPDLHPSPVHVASPVHPHDVAPATL